MKSLTLLSKIEKETGRDYAYRVLYHNIMILTLIPGESLNENDISEQLNLSRTPIHEALTQLKNQYLVDIIPQSGSRISQISLKNIREGLFMRTAVEPKLFKQLAGTISPEYLEEMEKLLKDSDLLISNNVETDSIDHFIRLDDDFHKISYLAAQKPILWDAMRTVCTHFQRVRYLEALIAKQDIKHIQEEHIKLYEYLLVGGNQNFNLEGFYENHLSYFKNNFAQVLKEYPKYFVKD